MKWLPKMPVSETYDITLIYRVSVIANGVSIIIDQIIPELQVVQSTAKKVNLVLFQSRRSQTNRVSKIVTPISV